MISQKELGYVGDYARKIPYPGIDYATEMGKKLVKAFEKYNEYHLNKEYDIILSNGEQILFEILNKNICHMLGLDYKSLNGEYNEKFRKKVLGVDYVITSYELLKKIVENIDDVLSYDYEVGGKIINYYRVGIKCAIFDSISDFDKFDFGVINFDKSKYLDKCCYNSEKLLYVQSNEAVSPYFFMGILREKPIEQSAKYVVETLIAPPSYKEYFENQEVVIPTQVITTTDNSMTKKEATAKEKLALINQYNAIVHEVGIENNLNIFGDYKAILAESTKTKVKSITR